MIERACLRSSRSRFSLVVLYGFANSSLLDSHR